MLRFRVFSDGKPVAKLDLSGAYLVGSDGVAVRAEIEFKKGEIRCQKRGVGPVGLAVVWPVNGAGRLMLETTRLPERERPYVLQVELARNRMMRLLHKVEDWEIDDPECGQSVAQPVTQSRDLLIQALQADDDAEAARLADESLAVGIRAAETLSLHHASTELARRRGAADFGKRFFGCGIGLDSQSDEYRRKLLEAFDFAAVPFSWRQIEPAEQKFNWGPLDNWVEWLSNAGIPIKGSNLVSFAEADVPDWLYIWEHDFETIRDLVYEHIRRVLNRYGQYIQTWDVVSGLHGVNCVSFNFEQLMELTRMAAAVTKQLLPGSTAIIELVAPWGEYYARNQRTIPPMLYADMALQSGINFDAFGLRCCFGAGLDGLYVRDLFQISSMIDRFAGRSKTLHVTAVQVPSDTAVDKGDAWKGAQSAAAGGAWHSPWTEDLQAQWLRGFYEIALSKSFVDSVTWCDLADAGGHYLPHGGLLRRDLTPKPAYQQLANIRKEIRGDGG
ncbi:MAG: endo-1,4-beta-xylanase [Planctomycetes bacterium]|nr:endo-1,4-beta-xylanase [Planctomycetota bacterium]